MVLRSIHGGGTALDRYGFHFVVLGLEMVALKVLSASELTVLMTSVSLWGAAFAYVSMGEVMEPIGFVGGLMILAACVVNALPGNKQTTSRLIYHGFRVLVC